MADPYPPLTPINCRFFLVEGDPGSPSAFRFIIDLREDCGDEAGKDTNNHTHGHVQTVKEWMFRSVQLPVCGPSGDWTASADVCGCLAPSLECNKPIWFPDVPTAMTGAATGTDVDNSLLRTSRTCLELTAMGNSIGASVRKKEDFI